jgi:hypothetical protein
MSLATRDIVARDWSGCNSFLLSDSNLLFLLIIPDLSEDSLNLHIYNSQERK